MCFSCFLTNSFFVLRYILLLFFSLSKSHYFSCMMTNLKRSLLTLLLNLSANWTNRRNCVALEFDIFCHHQLMLSNYFRHQFHFHSQKVNQWVGIGTKISHQNSMLSFKSLSTRKCDTFVQVFVFFLGYPCAFALLFFLNMETVSQICMDIYRRNTAFYSFRFSILSLIKFSTIRLENWLCILSIYTAQVDAVPRLMLKDVCHLRVTLLGNFVQTCQSFWLKMQAIATTFV